jgi:hypothetical protein
MSVLEVKKVYKVMKDVPEWDAEEIMNILNDQPSCGR